MFSGGFGGFNFCFGGAGHGKLIVKIYIYS